MLKFTKTTIAIASLLSTFAFSNAQAAASVGPSGTKPTEKVASVGPIGTNPNQVKSFVIGYTVNGRPVYSDGSISSTPVTEYAVERLQNGTSPHRNIDYSTGQVIVNTSKFVWDNDKQMYVDQTNAQAMNFAVTDAIALNIAQANNFSGPHDYTTGATNINTSATAADKVNPNPTTTEPEVPVTPVDPTPTDPVTPTEPEVTTPVTPTPTTPTVDTDNYMSGSDTIGQGPGANDNYMSGSDTVGQTTSSNKMQRATSSNNAVQSMIYNQFQRNSANPNNKK